MTRVSDTRAGSVPATPSRRHEPKALLFCPRCGHESPVDGDWELTLRPVVVDVHCPDCRELLTRRPLAAKERSGRDQ
jgi:predicted RNA-binding Zn-ribbon protein involved in translation (DUF1610 family)